MGFWVFSFKEQHVKTNWILIFRWSPGEIHGSRSNGQEWRRRSVWMSWWRCTAAFSRWKLLCEAAMTDRCQKKSLYFLLCSKMCFHTGLFFCFLPLGSRSAAGGFSSERTRCSCLSSTINLNVNCVAHEHENQRGKNLRYLDQCLQWGQFNSGMDRLKTGVSSLLPKEM